MSVRRLSPAPREALIPIGCIVPRRAAFPRRISEADGLRCRFADGVLLAPEEYRAMAAGLGTSEAPPAGLMERIAGRGSRRG